MFAAPVFVLGGPLIHLWSGHGRTALASLALRVLLPVTLVFLAASASSLFHPLRGNIGDLGPPMLWGSIGLAAGFLITTAIDVTVLSGSIEPVERNLVLATLGVVGVSFAAFLMYQLTRN